MYNIGEMNFYYPFEEKMNFLFNGEYLYVSIKEDMEDNYGIDSFKDKTLLSISVVNDILFLILDNENLGMFYIPININFYHEYQPNKLLSAPKIKEITFVIITEDKQEKASVKFSCDEDFSRKIQEAFIKQAKNNQFKSLSEYNLSAIKTMDCVSDNEIYREGLPNSYIFYKHTEFSA